MTLKSAMFATIPEITISGVALSLLPLLGAGWFFYRWGAGARLLGYATARMVVQLIGIGYVLIYIFESRHWQTCAAVLTVIIGVSSWIAMRPLKASGAKIYLRILGAIALGGCGTLALDLAIIQKGSALCEPRIFIPIAGMVFANAMNALSLAAERAEKELATGRDWEEARADAFNAAMIPKINMFLAVGLVSLPGIMTGQILAGVSPLIAVRYQILVMAMILGSSALSVAFFFLFSRKELEAQARQALKKNASP